MRILMVSDFETQHGAAVATSRLASGLVRRGHETVRVVAFPDGTEHPWRTVRLPAHRRLATWANGLTGMRADRVLGPFTRRRLSRIVSDFQPDAINVHNLHGAYFAGFTPELLEIAEVAPTVWTLHDMWSFTGRCAYSKGCPLFLTGCDKRCPTPHEYPALRPTRIRPAWERRQDVLSAHPDVNAIAPSRWLAREARRGAWRDHRVNLIPYDLPLDVFHPRDAREVRSSLGIGEEETVVLTAADDLSEARKGGAILAEALTRISTPFTLLTVGRGRIPQIHRRRSIELGFVSRPDDLARMLTAADLMIHPAIADNLPQVVMESIACGTPVVAFDVGGLGDMVREGQTGWLAPEVTSRSLASTIERAMSEFRGLDYRTTCVSVARQEYAAPQQATRYEEVFKELLRAAA